MTHNSTSLLYVSYSWNFRHRLVRYYWYFKTLFQILPFFSFKSQFLDNLGLGLGHFWFGGETAGGEFAVSSIGCRSAARATATWTAISYCQRFAKYHGLFGFSGNWWWPCRGGCCREDFVAWCARQAQTLEWHCKQGQRWLAIQTNVHPG